LAAFQTLTIANPNNGVLERWTHGLGILFWGMMFTLWTSGCVHTSHNNGFAASWIEATEALHGTGAGFETAEFLDFTATA
jgi:hypothetical protein